jgi:hypothetical protein
MVVSRYVQSHKSAGVDASISADVLIVDLEIRVDEARTCGGIFPIGTLPANIREHRTFWTDLDYFFTR